MAGITKGESMTEKLYVFLWEATTDNGGTMRGEITSTSAVRAEEALQKKG